MKSINRIFLITPSGNSLWIQTGVIKGLRREPQQACHEEMARKVPSGGGSSNATRHSAYSVRAFFLGLALSSWGTTSSSSSASDIARASCVRWTQ